MNTPVLEVLSLRCERGGRALFTDLAFRVEAGTCLYVAGDNGAGKTSLLRILAGLLAPVHGQVRWRGRPIDEARDEYGADLAFVGHHNGIKDDLTALENVAFGATLHGQAHAGERSLEALRALGLEGYEHAPVRRLSQGQKRRVALARLAAGRPCGVWVLDEPFNALDRASVATLNAMVAAQVDRGGIVVLTAHQEVELPARAHRLVLGERPAQQGSAA